MHTTRQTNAFRNFVKRTPFDRSGLSCAFVCYRNTHKQYTQAYKLALSKLCELRVQVLQHWLTVDQVRAKRCCRHNGPFVRDRLQADVVAQNQVHAVAKGRVSISLRAIYDDYPIWVNANETRKLVRRMFVPLVRSLARKRSLPIDPMVKFLTLVLSLTWCHLVHRGLNSFNYTFHVCFTMPFHMATLVV